VESYSSHSRTPRPRGDVGAILLSSLVKFVLVLGIIAVAGYDTFSIAATQVSARDEAQQAAQVALDSLTARETPRQAYRAAVDYVTENGGGTIPEGGFSVAADDTVTLTLTRTAPTLLAGRLSFLDEYVHAEVTTTAEHSSY
jgi:Tfp pilus assembly protein PilV